MNRERAFSRFRLQIMNAIIEAVDSDMVSILRKKTEGERLRIAWGMWSSAREMLRNLIRAENRNWSEPKIQLEAARRLAHGPR